MPSALAPDPFHVEPGAILLSRRFCVIGPLRHRTVGWQVAATDLNRRFGVPPHHRLELIFLPADEATRDRVFAVLDAMAGDVVRVYAVLATDDGLAIVAHPHEAAAGELSADAHRQVAYDLARLLSRLHEAGWSRIRWTADDWRLDAQGRVQFADWSWVLGVEPAERPEVQTDDVEALQRQFQGASWPPEATRPVSSAAELLVGLAPPVPAMGPPLLLADEAPFVGRLDALAIVQQTVDASRQSGPTSLVLRGPSGSGRSRLLLHAAERLEADAIVVRCAKPHVDGLVTALADTFDALESVRRREITDRISRQIGDGATELCIFDRRFEAWFGSPPPRQRVVRQYPHRLTRLVALLAAVGAPRHPLVLLVDRFDEASGAVRALVQRLLADGESHCTAIIRADTSGDAARDVLTLAPLLPDEVLDWLRGTLPGSVEDVPAIADWLLEQGDAWPAQLGERLQWAISESVLVNRIGWRLTATPPFQRTTLVDLDDDARWVALLLAVEGGRGGARALRQLSRWPVDRLRETLNTLRRSGLVRAVGPALRFACASRRRELLEAASPDRRRNAHRAMARYLARQPDVSTSALVFHEDRGRVDGLDASLAQRHLRAAEEQLHHLNFERARWHFERASVWDADPDVQRRAHRGRADALLLTGCTREALGAYREALDHARGPEDVLAIADRASSALVVRSPADTLALVDDALGRLGYPVPGGLLPMLWQGLRTWLGLGAQLGPAASLSLGKLHRSLVDMLPLRRASRLPILWFRGFAMARRIDDPTGARRARIQFARGPLGALRPAWSHRVLAEAIQEAQRSNEPLVEGLGWLGRAEQWWPTGRSADVVHGLERAAACFGTAEATLLKARAEAALVVHQLFCEPVRTLEARLEALRRTARQQHQQDIGPLLDALGAWLKVRSGRSPGDLVPSGPPAGTVVGVWADAVAALAWIEIDEVVLATEFADRACHQVHTGLVRSPAAVDLALVASAWVGMRRGHPFVTLTRRRLRRLAARARRNPNLRPFASLVEAHRAAADGDVPGARSAVERVLQTAALQRQRWVELEGHALLADLWATSDPQQAEQQRARTRELRAQLVDEPSVVAHASRSDPSGPPDEPTRLDTVVHDMLETLRPHLDGRDVETALTAGVRTPVRREALELLVVSMMLLVHEAAEGPRIRLYTEVRSRDHVSLTIEAGPASEEPSALAVAECDTVARQIGAAFAMHVRPEGMVLEAHLPLDQAVTLHQGLVAISVDDGRVERTLVEQLRSLGWDAMIPHLDDRLDADVAGCFVAPGRHLAVPQGAWSITVAPRADGWRHRGELPLPFALDELRLLLEDPPPTTES
ncbi:MAG: AAA family ATPase [Myxococcota bacterium]